MTDERADADEPGGWALDPEPWGALARAVLVEEGVSGELDLTFVDEAAMSALNAEHMGQEGPTDVLAFPLDGGSAEPAPTDVEVPRLLGDVVICSAVARGNAAAHAGPDHDGTAEEELALLVVHGVLHVLGWEHASDDDRTAMQAREQYHLGRWHRSGVRSAEAVRP